MPEIDFTVRLVNSEDEPLEGFKVIVCSTNILRPHDQSHFTDDDGLAEFTMETFMEDNDTIDIWVKASTSMLSVEKLHMGEYNVEDGGEITVMIPDDDYAGTESAGNTDD